MPGTESQAAFDLLNERLPGMNADGALARFVFEAPAGELLTDPVNAEAVRAVAATMSEDPAAVQVTDPFTTINPAGTVAYFEVNYGVSAQDLPDESKDRIETALEQGRATGLTVEAGGDALFAEIGGQSSELIGVIVAAIILTVTFGALIPAGLTLLNALIGVAISITAITAATGIWEMSSTSSTLALMLGLAVAIDYSLFIVSRYRDELARGRNIEEAIGRALGTAGTAVAFAALTVIIALVGLAVVNIPLLTEMGVAAAFAVLIAALIALTLLPALLRFTGLRIFSRRQRRLGYILAEAKKKHRHPAATWVHAILRRPALFIAAGVIGLGVVALPLADLQLGLPDDGTAAESTTQRKAYDILSRGFGPGFNGPLMIVLDLEGASDPQVAVDQFIASTEGVANVAAVSPAQILPDNRTAILSVIPTTAPTSGDTETLVSDIRATASGFEEQTGAGLYVTGKTAVAIDVSTKLGDALIPYLAVVVGLSLILLTIVFRSLLVPLKATLGFLLSVGATMGSAVAIFQWGWFSDLLGLDSTGPIVSFLPIILIGVVFGLAMDYEVFLVTRMREEYMHGASSGDAVANGFIHGAKVVAAAAAIMISVFAAFILSGEDIVMQIGLSLALAVAFDAFVVRMTIVPAVLALLGDRAWKLPAWLARLLPDIDVEGAKLTELLDESDHAPAVTEQEPELTGARSA
jgi:RND superfamily putative drug exporter